MENDGDAAAGTVHLRGFVTDDAKDPRWRQDNSSPTAGVCELHSPMRGKLPLLPVLLPLRLLQRLLVFCC